MRVLNFSERFTSIAVLALSFLAIAAAAGFEHIAKLPPCPLCLYQRWPFYAVIIMSALALNLIMSGRTALARAALLLCALALAMNAGLGVYHAGVEWKWWAGPSACAAGAAATAGDASSLMERLRETRVVRCDEAALRILGLSLAGYSAMLSVALAAFILFALTRRSLARAAIKGPAGRRRPEKNRANLKNR